MKKRHFGILAVLILSGCGAHVHQLIKEDKTQLVSGELVHDSGDSNRLILKFSDRSYEARGFVVERQRNLAELRKRYYGVNPKHWERIFSGLDTDHVTYSVETIAISAEGDKVSCRLVWGGSAKPAGVCTDQAGAAIPVHFE